MTAPIIPQNPEQALQRQQADAHAASIQPAANPDVELHQLRQAVRDHRDEIEAAGPLALEATLSDEQLEIMRRKHGADSILWAHVPEAI